MMRPRPFARKTRVALGLVLVGLLATGSAFAYWTTHGTGSGSASAGTLQTVTLDTVSFSAARLRPSGPTTPVTINVLNPNTFPVTVATLTAGTITSDTAGCDGTNAAVTLNLGALQTATIVSGANALTASASMGAASASACQGAIFSTSLNLVVHK